MSKQQNYANHKRYVPLYHFVLSPFSTLILIASFVYLISEQFSIVSIFVCGFSICIFILVMLVRQFATRLQDRSIYHEENSRHMRLTGKPLDSILTLKQIIALRFAEDDAFPQLCIEAARSGIEPNQIKKSIKRWRADFIRV